MVNYVKETAGETLFLEIGNGANPEVFTASCTINTTRAVDFSGAASTTEVADCDNPGNPAKTVRQIKSVDLKFTGSGVSDAPSLLALIQWQQGGTAKNCKITQNLAGAAGGWTITVPMVVTALTLTGVRGEMQTFSGTFEQADVPTIIANA